MSHGAPDGSASQPVPPSRKRRAPEVKMEEDEVATVGADGSIDWYIPNICEIRPYVKFSAHKDVEGVRWKIGARTTSLEEENEDGKHLSLFLYAPKSESPLWEFRASLEFIVKSTKGADFAHRKQLLNISFSHAIHNWGFIKFLSWKALIDPNRGFLVDDSLAVEIRMTVHHTAAIRRPRKFDYADGDDKRNDVTLVVEGEKIYVNRQYLALYSPVFDTMFNNGYREEGQKEINIEDTNYQEFVNLLDVIYPCHKPLTDNTVQGVLHLADRYQIKFAVDAAEEYLISKSCEATSTRLLLSDKYRLFRLQDECLLKLRTRDDVAKLKNTQEYSYFSDAMKITLLEIMFKRR